MSERIVGTQKAPEFLDQNIRAANFKTLDAQKISIAVDLQSEYWALIGGLSTNVGVRDGQRYVSWTIDGVQSIDFSACETDQVVVFNVDADYDANLFTKQVHSWLDELAERRTIQEEKLATQPAWHAASMLAKARDNNRQV